MKKKIFTYLTVLACVLSFCVSSVMFTACNNGVSVTMLKENIIDDAYDNYYEIFVYSYCDSDGDGYGDLNGVTSKLDYIRDLGYTGIWLMPIHDSASYHGYDVKNYKSVRSIFGDIDDYKNLIKSAHEKGIKVIIDLVVNHTSSQHPWFKSALAYKKGQGGDSKYAEYYNWATTSTAGYNQDGNVWYESRFDKGMPDLNLSSTAVRQEIEDIMKYWLGLGTDGFRLDGCKYYYSSVPDSVAFCKWIKDTAVKYNDKAYIVGEMWDGRSLISQFYESGCDSFFSFPTQEAIKKSVLTSEAAQYWKSYTQLTNMCNGYIPAPFLSNHDNGVGRITSVMTKDAAKAKFAYGLISMYSGNTFTYYGDEIGMIGSHVDQDIRIGMLWDNAKTGITKSPPGTVHEEYVFDGVAEQLEDDNSILNYYKLCNNARNAFPAIMRGTAERITYDDTEVLVMKKTYDSESVTVVINFGEGEKSVEGIQGSLAQGICVQGRIKQQGSALKMPAYSIAILA